MKKIEPKYKVGDKVYYFRVFFGDIGFFKIKEVVAIRHKKTKKIIKYKYHSPRGFYANTLGSYEESSLFGTLEESKDVLIKKHIEVVEKIKNLKDEDIKEDKV